MDRSKLFSLLGKIQRLESKNAEQANIIVRQNETINEMSNLLLRCKGIISDVVDTDGDWKLTAVEVYEKIDPYLPKGEKAK
jgi:hypothetical protein